MASDFPLDPDELIDATNAVDYDNERARYSLAAAKYAAMIPAKGRSNVPALELLRVTRNLQFEINNGYDWSESRWESYIDNPDTQVVKRYLPDAFYDAWIAFARAEFARMTANGASSADDLDDERNYQDTLSEEEEKSDLLDAYIGGIMSGALVYCFEEIEWAGFTSADALSNLLSMDQRQLNAVEAKRLLRLVRIHLSAENDNDVKSRLAILSMDMRQRQLKRAERVPEKEVEKRKRIECRVCGEVAQFKTDFKGFFRVNPNSNAPRPDDTGLYCSRICQKKCNTNAP